MRGELETYWPPVPLTIAALLFSFCWAAQPGFWWPKPSPASWFSLPRTATQTAWIQLTRTVCGTGLYNCSTPTCFPWASQLHRIQPVHGQGYILISSNGCTCFLIDGRVEGQYVTLLGWFVKWEAGDRNTAVLRGAASRICISQHVAFSFNFFLCAFCLRPGDASILLYGHSHWSCMIS